MQLFKTNILIFTTSSTYFEPDGTGMVQSVYMPTVCLYSTVTYKQIIPTVRTVGM